MNSFFTLLYLSWIRLIDQAQRDELTGLLNRRGFDEALKQQGAIASRYARSLCLLLIDLRGLKSRNESEGYEAGDRALQQTARFLEREVRKADLICRIGGDEFALLLPETDLSAGHQLAARLQKGLQAEGIGIYFGLASGDPHSLLNRADRAS